MSLSQTIPRLPKMHSSYSLAVKSRSSLIATPSHSQSSDPSSLNCILSFFEPNYYSNTDPRNQTFIEFPQWQIAASEDPDGSSSSSLQTHLNTLPSRSPSPESIASSPCQSSFSRTPSRSTSPESVVSSPSQPSLGTLPSRPPSPDMTENEADGHSSSDREGCVTSSKSQSPEPAITRKGKPLAVIALPPEVRDRIYKFLLGAPYDPLIYRTTVFDSNLLAPSDDEHRVTHFERTKTTHPTIIYRSSRMYDLRILCVSKQTYAEAFHIYYATHCFSFSDTNRLLQFLRNIGYNRRQHLSTIDFMWRGTSAKAAFRLLKTCTRLTSVNFTLPCSRPPGYAALKEVRGLTQARAKAMVHFKAPRRHVRSSPVCHGTYHCHCDCTKTKNLKSDIQELETAMTRPRLKKYALNPDAELDFFNSRPELSRRSEYQLLMEETSVFLERGQTRNESEQR